MHKVNQIVDGASLKLLYIIAPNPESHEDAVAE